MARAPGVKPPLWWRAIAWTVGTAVQSVLWGLGFAFLVTGIVMWRNWHALAERGVDATGQVERCVWKSMFKRGSGGFYSCDYAYRPSPDGPVHDGHFQSQRHWEPGQPIPIRYLPDWPETSAAAKDLEHPSITTGAMIAIGAGWLGWLAWLARKERLRRATPAGQSASPG